MLALGKCNIRVGCYCHEHSGANKAPKTPSELTERPSTDPKDFVSGKVEPLADLGPEEMVLDVLSLTLEGEDWLALWPGDESPSQPPAPGAIRKELLTLTSHTPRLHSAAWQAGRGLLSQRARARRLHYCGVHFRPSRYYQLLTFSCWIRGRILPFLPVPHHWVSAFTAAWPAQVSHRLPW